MKTVGEVAELAGVTVRLLHHYDDLGALCPRAVRRWLPPVVVQRPRAVREILAWCQLGFPLAEIKALVEHPSRDRSSTLETPARAGRVGARAQPNAARALLLWTRSSQRRPASVLSRRRQLNQDDCKVADPIAGAEAACW